MAILFYSIKKKNPRTGEIKYYASHRKHRTYDLVEIAERMAKKSTFTTADVYGLLEGLTIEIPKMLMEGNHVKLGDLGTFCLKINSRPEESHRKVDVWSIIGTSINFFPGKRIRGMMKMVKFKKDQKIKQTQYQR